MLVHQCTECEKVSINRIAADDDTEKVFEVFKTSLAMSLTMQTQLRELGIWVLCSTDLQLVWSQLFGIESVATLTKE